MTTLPPAATASAAACLAPFFNVPPAQQAMLDDVGRRWADDVPAHIERVIDAYTALLRAGAAGDDDLVVERELAYGPHARHRLDVYRQAHARGADMLVFVHGGAFVRGDKAVNDVLYANVCRWFARQGVVAVNVEYRLAGDAPFPGGAEDVGAATRYLSGVAAALGADPSRLFLMGHSAGGTHVAGYCGDPLLARAYARAPVAGAILVSARLRADVRPGNPNAAAVRSYFGPDAHVHEAHSPVTHAAAFRTTAMVAVAEYENPYLDAYGAQMMAGLLDAPVRRPHRFVQMLRHNHLSIVAHFGTGEERLGREILDFMRRT
ncbi:MAG: alpha/beta hydrolase fold domain-containing protein [Burkholderiales bacterium]|jgi:hypothetical protein|nr:alpha/beta hydrolase fold domain-containing protein [Burkholderiales bacterium]